MITLLITAAASTWAMPVSSPVTQRRREAFESCVVKSATSLAGSPDTADIVATAAIESCETEKRAYFASQKTSDGKQMGIRYLRALDNALNEKVRSKAILAITRVRAKARH